MRVSSWASARTAPFASSAASFATLALGATFALGVPALAVGCSSDPAASPAPTTKCDSSACTAGNTCVAFEGETKCRLTCGTAFGLRCPATHTCVSDPTVGGFCHPLRTPVTLQAKGQWGAACVALDGVDNPGCDGAQGFKCHAPRGPADAEAYCTRFDCADDRDCPDTYACENVNASPNAGSNERIVGDVRKTCVKRDYCASCRTDADCPSIKGSTQFCVEQYDGSGRKVCAPSCESARNCNDEAECFPQGEKQWPDGIVRETSVCLPLSDSCVGNGELCAGCRSDADCPKGACVQGEFTTEKFCTVKSEIPCELVTENGQTRLKAQCPQLPANVPATGVTCTGNLRFQSSLLNKEVPKDQCFGVVDLDEGDQPGCWTRKR